MLQGLHHVSLKASGEAQFEGVLAFYTQVLDCPLVRTWGQGEDRGAMLDLGNTLLEVTANGAPGQEKGLLRHIAFATDNVDDAVERAAQAGCPVLIAPVDKMLGEELPIRIAFCAGPAGEEIEFFQIRRLEGSEKCS